MHELLMDCPDASRFIKCRGLETDARVMVTMERTGIAGSGNGGMMAMSRARNNVSCGILHFVSSPGAACVEAVV